MKRKVKTRKNKSHTLVYVVLTLVLVVFFLTLYLYYQETYFGSAYKKALGSQDPNDICATPSGYTDEQWKEHMSHHPDIYRNCL